MPDKGLKDLFTRILHQAVGTHVKVVDYQSISGGCIHNASKITTSDGEFFVKYNTRADSDMFEKEYEGLNILSKAAELTIPEPVAAGTLNDKSYLLTEFIASGPRQPDFWEQFGKSLADLHRDHSRERYGLDHDNYIGRLPQMNKDHEDWIEFFVSMRLEVQIKMALDNELVDRDYVRQFERIYDKLRDLLPEERPMLLHGDLWSGNFMTGADGYAVLIDPAVYYGNREIELSFTKMFGGFDNTFYDHYHEQFPLEPGFEERVDIYNMYPSLVHVNLFGTSYLSGVTPVIKRYT